MKTIGIIGGFGPETTAKFQIRIIEICAQIGLSGRPPIIIWNSPVPMELEQSLLIDGQNIQKFLPLLINSAKILEKSGCDFLVLPCNTLHFHLNAIKNKVKIPILNIIDECVSFLEKANIHKVAVLGTSVTINSHMHLNKMIAKHMEPIFPSTHQQIALNHLIHKININSEMIKSKDSLLKIITSLSQECDNNFLLACTDLQLVNIESKKFRIFDSMEILAQATVKHSLA